MEVDGYDLSADRKNQVKLGCINSCTWIGMHHNDLKHINELNEMVPELMQQNIEALGTPEATATMNSTMLQWQGIVL